MNDDVIKREVLLRDKYSCLICGKRGVDVHEIVPRSYGKHAFVFSMKNRICLCPSCHSKAHTRKERDRAFKILDIMHGYRYSDEEKEIIKIYSDYHHREKQE